MRFWKRWRNRWPMHEWTFIVMGDSGRVEEYKVTANIREQAEYDAEQWFELRYNEPGHVVMRWMGTRID